MGDATAYLAEVDFVEDDLVGVADSPEPGHKGQDGDDDKDSLVVALGAGGGLGSGGLDELIKLDI
jgi:hypothetical protein